MARSKKKTPYCGDKKGKDKKRVANSSVRAWLKQHPEETLQQGSFKKVYNTWDICDYYTRKTWDEYWQHCCNWYDWRISHDIQAEVPDWNKEYRNWLKWYINK